MIDIIQVADDADMIIDGYAFTKCHLGYKVLNLNNPEKAAVISSDGKMLETTMDEIEVALILKIYSQDREYLEEVDA